MFSRKCYCMNNNYSQNSCELKNDIMENKCENVISYEENIYNAWFGLRNLSEWLGADQST